MPNRRFTRHIHEAHLCLTHEPFFFVEEFSKEKDQNTKLMLEAIHRLEFAGFAYEKLDEALRTFFAIGSAMEAGTVGLVDDHSEGLMQVQFYTEAIYIELARVVAVARAISGPSAIKRFEPQGCLRVRHELIAHPETISGGPVLSHWFRIRSLEMGGPIIKNRRDAGEPNWPADLGLMANLADFDSFWERWMVLIMSAPDGETEV